jgi:molybdopterin adenylyltransferase
MDHLRAYSFISLCHHLRSHSNEVSNIDLMSISGFCRNCLAKWLVLHARTLSSQIMTMSSSYPAVSNSQQQIVESLNMFDYDMAAQYVYGCTYITWKERYQTKATDAQLEKYNNSKPIHAIHDDNLLAPTRHHHHHDVVQHSSSSCSKEVVSLAGQSTSPNNNKVQTCTINVAAAASSRPVVNSLLLSDVCCQDVESLVAAAAHGNSSSTVVPSPRGWLTSSTNTIPLLKPPKGGHHNIILKVGILTISDRASNNAYETGDLSGPAVENTIIGLVNQMNNTSFLQEAEEDQQQQQQQQQQRNNSIIIEHIEKAIVPDDIESIKDVLLCWSGKKSIKDDNELPSSYYDLVLTTGGTGFSSRDVTPEATNQILDRQCLGLMSWASMELTNLQPLATLSRASAGTCRDTLIVNLPGNPAGAAQVVELLFPLLLYAIKDLQSHK